MNPIVNLKQTVGPYLKLRSKLESPLYFPFGTFFSSFGTDVIFYIIFPIILQELVPVVDYPQKALETMKKVVKKTESYLHERENLLVSK